MWTLFYQVVVHQMFNFRNWLIALWFARECHYIQKYLKANGHDVCMTLASNGSVNNNNNNM